MGKMNPDDQEMYRILVRLRRLHLQIFYGNLYCACMGNENLWCELFRFSTVLWLSDQFVGCDKRCTYSFFCNMQIRPQNRFVSPFEDRTAYSRANSKWANRFAVRAIGRLCFSNWISANDATQISECICIADEEKQAMTQRKNIIF